MWCTPVAAGASSEEVTRRCRHAVAAVGPYVFIFGGLRGSTLLDDFLLADDSSGTELSICDPRSPAWCRPPRAALAFARHEQDRSGTCQIGLAIWPGSPSHPNVMQARKSVLNWPRRQIRARCRFHCTSCAMTV